MPTWIRQVRKKNSEICQIEGKSLEPLVTLGLTVLWLAGLLLADFVGESTWAEWRSMDEHARTARSSCQEQSAGSEDIQMRLRSKVGPHWEGLQLPDWRRGSVCVIEMIKWCFKIILWWHYGRYLRKRFTVEWPNLPICLRLSSFLGNRVFGA